MKKLFPFLFILLSNYSFAQFSASNDTVICAGQSVQLSVTGGSTYSWSPSITLSSPSSANPVATPTQTTSYVVSSPLSNANMVVNGDFAQGNFGFTSSYVYEVPTNILGPGSYFVGGNANHWNTGMSALCNDRNTDSDTMMLIANSSTVANTPVWCQSFTVYPNCTYSLSAYFITMNQTNLNPMRWMVNGTPVGANAGPPFFQCQWVNVASTWNSGTNTTANFCLYNPTLAANGNDFSIDQISITGSGTMYDTVTVTVANSPVVNLGNDTAVCNVQSFVLDAGNSGSSYVWSDNSTAQTLTATSTGSYSVTVTDANSCSASDALTVSQYNLSATASATNTSCGLNNGSATVTTNNGHTPFTYSWNTTGTTSTVANLTAGTYTVTVNDAEGCSATASATVNPSGNGTVSITATQTLICASDSSTICAPSGYNAYLWNTGNTTACITTSLAGNYYVTVTDIGSCTVSSNQLALAVYPLPPVSITVNGDTLTAYNAQTYQWYLNGNVISGATANTFIANQPGNYSVLVTDSNGCAATSTVIPITTGIEDVTVDGNLFVYPNPNSVGSWQLIVGSEFIGDDVHVFDVDGRVVFKSAISNQQSAIILNVSSGIYLLKISSEQKAFTRKLIKL